MAATYQLSPQRPHISLSPSDEIVDFDCLQTPITTFTALLSAAQSVVLDTSTATERDSTLVPDSLVTQRRLRNRVSCRKTRLKRKLQHHALEILARERQERHEYLTKLSQELRVEDNEKDELVAGRTHQTEHDVLFRDLAARSLHYALVDQEYRGWNDDGNGQVTSRPATTKTKQESEEAANVAMKRSKRLRCASDINVSTMEMKEKSEEATSVPMRKSKRLRRTRDISTAPQDDSESPQTSLFKQWRPIVDGLTNVDLKLHRMKENDLGESVFDRHCYWKFIGVNSVKMQRDGEIAAVAVSGTTRLRFHGRCVQEVSICVVRRKDDAPFDISSIHNNIDESVRKRQDE